MTSPSLDPLFFRRLKRLFGILFQHYKSRASIIFYILTLLSLLMQFVIYAAGLVPSRYFEVLGAKDSSSFTQLATYSIVLIVLNAVMKSALTYVSRVLYLTWKQTLCTKIHCKYFIDLNFYKLNVLDKTLDNIDQRITRDVDQFTREWSLLVSRLVVIPFTIGYYSYQCFVSTTWLGPVTIYAYFIVGTIINRLIMAPIVRLHVEKEVREGNFRYQHMRVRTHAESIAFYQAGRTEHKRSNSSLNHLLRRQMSLFNWSFWLNSSVNIFDYVGGILSYLVIAVPIFAGNYDELAPEEISALISRNSFVCIYLIHSFSQLIDMSSTVGDIAAHTHRLAQLFESFDREKTKSTYINYSFDDDDEISNGSGSFSAERAASRYTEKTEHHEGDRNYLCVNDLTVVTPDNMSTLVKELNLTISAGHSILVTGNTGSGKTSFLRVLAGLWKAPEGRVEKKLAFGPRGVMYLPQKPLMCGGTLLEQIIYPQSELYPEFSKAVNINRITAIVEEVGLTEVVENNGGLEGKEDLNWSDTLSHGEMQCLSFARLFYHHPDLAVLDEPTSGLDKRMEDKLFELCKERKITCLTVAHGSNLKKHHVSELHLAGNGDWSIRSLF